MKYSHEEHDFQEALSDILQQNATPQRYKKQRVHKLARKDLTQAKISAKRSQLVAKKHYRKAKHEFHQKESEDRKRIYKISLGIGLVLILIFIIPALVSRIFTSTPPINETIRETLTFKPYLPSSLPFGFTLRDDSITQPEDGVILYNIMNERGSLINVSQQPMPKDLDQDKAVSILSNHREIDTAIGRAIIGESATGQTVVNIFTKESWMIITYNMETISDEALTTFIKNLRKV